MSSVSPDSCAHVIGLLIPRNCQAPATARCATCGRALCDEHKRPEGKCDACLSNTQDPQHRVTIPQELVFDAESLAAFELESISDPVSAWTDLT